MADIGSPNPNSTYAVVASSPGQSVTTTKETGGRPAEVGHIARVEVPAEHRPAEHLPGTWKLPLYGPGALSARPEQIGAAMLSEGLISTMETWKKAAYYRLQSPFERFVSFGG